MQLSGITFELAIFALYLVMIVWCNTFFTRVFTRFIDPKGEYNLGHGVPLPGLVRWFILAMALIFPVMIASFLAAIVRLFI